MLASAGYRYSLQYAKERRQGRHPEQKDPAAPPVALVEHADVRRMLLRQKCISEGALALALQAALWIDQQSQDPDEAARREAGLLLEFITPVLKAWSAEWCTLSNDLAVQVLGGYGYTREYPVEQFLRDNRLNPIHEGANGIQAIDLLGRKLMMAEGAGFRLLAERMRRDAASAKDVEGLRELADEFASCLALAVETTQALAATLKRGELRLGLANASHYLNLMGHLCIAWQWLRKASVAARAMPRHDADRDFYSGQAQACRFFFRQELPAIRAWAGILQSLEPSALEMRVEWL
jgi:butyryl-CoA dehydrogenase